MKDQVQENITYLYSDYCKYIDEDDNHVSDHEFYKDSLKFFMEWLTKGFIINFLD